MAVALQNTSKEALSRELQFDDPTMVVRFTRLLSLSPEFYELITWGSAKGCISLTAASEAARVEDTAARNKLIKAIVEHEFSSKEVKQIIQAYAKGSKPMAACAKETLASRPQIIRRYVLAGALSPELQAMMNRRSMTERDALLARVVGPLLLSGEHFTAKLGFERFVIVTSENGNRSLIEAGAKTGSDFGALIRQELLRAIQNEQC